MSRIDPSLTIAYLLASAAGLLIIFSISPDRLLTQAIWLVSGLIIFLYLSRQDSAVFTALSRPAYPLALILLVLTLVFGQEVRGSLRWIPLGSFNLQTSEIAKPLLILAFARLFSARPPTSLKNILLSLLYLALPLALILNQPDLGTALIILAIFVGQLFIAGAPVWLFGLGAIVSGLVAYYAPAFLAPYQLRRLESFLDPALDPLGSGYNAIQSTIAIGSGGLFGKGLGRGTQSHLSFLPERHTDFVFASLVEELGLLGGLSVILILGLFLYRLASLLLISLPRQEKLIIAGVFSYLLFQTFINIGMNLALVPVTGVTLPLVSYGGSSILALSLALGVAGSVSRAHPQPQALIEIK